MQPLADECVAREGKCTSRDVKKCHSSGKMKDTYNVRPVTKESGGEKFTAAASGLSQSRVCLDHLDSPELAV